MLVNAYILRTGCFVSRCGKCFKTAEQITASPRNEASVTVWHCLIFAREFSKFDDNYSSIYDVTEILNRISAYLRASLGVENVEGQKDTVELIVEQVR